VPKLGCLRIVVLPRRVHEVADNQAGICIMQEAGGVVFGAKGTELDGKVDAKLLCECRSSLA
jgi:fructose-1,6-bisphosphatase/inositol monophosphatase family enzyme